MLVTGYSNLSLSTHPVALNAPIWIARFKLDGDVAVLFPYINTAVEDAIYYDNPHYIQFKLTGVSCHLYPDHACVAPFAYREQAVEFVSRLISFLNDLYKNKDAIKPDPRRYKPQPVLQIFRLLPRSNCRACGFLSCMAFAAAVSRKDAFPEQCPDFSKPISETAVYPVYDRAGNVVSTVAIDVDTSKGRVGHESQGQDIETQEAQPSHTPDVLNRSEPPSCRDKNRFALTAREIEVLRLLVHGHTNNEISRLLSISPHTVKSHIIHIFNKSGVNDRTQAAVWAIRNNLF